jgi:hypothetical protein
MRWVLLGTGRNDVSLDWERCVLHHCQGTFCWGAGLKDSATQAQYWLLCDGLLLPGGSKAAAQKLCGATIVAEDWATMLAGWMCVRAGTCLSMRHLTEGASVCSLRYACN